MPTIAESGAQNSGESAGVVSPGQPEERVQSRTAAGSGSAAVRRDQDRDSHGAMPRPPPPSEGRGAARGGSQRPALSGVGRGGQIFGPGTRGVVAGQAAGVESAGIFGPPPRQAGSVKAQAPPPQGRGLRIPQFSQGGGTAPANYEMPANSVPLTSGQYVTVGPREDLIAMLGAHWTAHYNEVAGGKLVGSVYRRSNNLLYVHFIDERGFPLGFTLPPGALIPFEGEPPAALQGFVKQRPPPASVPQRGNSARMRQHQQPGGVAGIHVLPARHAQNMSGVGSAGRSRTCSVQ
eukprot:Hpha_TRINITY_DN16239_c0_g3::TRINITY_DN16239_c0_g3_i1::g.14563::m.14563